MAERRRAVNILTKILKKPRFLAITEYWVYLPGESLPEQKTIMHRMLAGNPYGPAHASPIGHAEGMVFSDIRTHIALILRSKNPHAFRPDLFSERVHATAEQLKALDDAQSFVKVRYISEEPLPDKRHVAFAIHAADAIAELGDARIVFDVSAERLYDKAELEQVLRGDPEGKGADAHVRVVWKEFPDGGAAETYGLKKLGLPELVTKDMEPDEQVLVSEVLSQAARELWKLGTWQQSVDIQAFEDEFRVECASPKSGKSLVRILRVQIK